MFFYTYTHRNNVGNYHFVWKVPNDVARESCHTQNLHLIESIKPEIPVYHTRAMKQEFYNLMGRISPESKPYILRSIYHW